MKKAISQQTLISTVFEAAERATRDLTPPSPTSTGIAPKYAIA